MDFNLICSLLGDMIEVFKITDNIYDTTVSPNLSYNERANTRGNNYKLHYHSFHYDLRKLCLSARVVNIWNRYLRASNLVGAWIPHILLEFPRPTCRLPHVCMYVCIVRAGVQPTLDPYAEAFI